MLLECLDRVPLSRRELLCWRLKRQANATSTNHPANTSATDPTAAADDTASMATNHIVKAAAATKATTAEAADP